MKNKKNPIVIVDVLLRKNKHKGVVQKAEELSEIINVHNGQASVEEIDLDKHFNLIEGTYSNIGPYTEFKYNVSEDSKEVKVIMMTEDRIEYLKKQCTYLGSHYYIKQTEAFERVPFSISLFNLN
jgi:hypothetical protein